MSQYEIPAQSIPFAKENSLSFPLDTSELCALDLIKTRGNISLAKYHSRCYSAGLKPKGLPKDARRRSAMAIDQTD